MAAILRFAGQRPPGGSLGLTAAPAQVFAGGADLGPPGPRIGGLGRWRRPLVDALRAQREHRDVRLTEVTPTSLKPLAFKALIAECEPVADLARAVRAADTPAAIHGPKL